MTRLRLEDGYGFTLVELMVVVLIIGILVSIALPVYVQARLMAERRTCQANQRTLWGAIALAGSTGDRIGPQSSGALAPGGSGWYAFLVPAWVADAPKCPADSAYYLMGDDGTLLGDNGTTAGFKEGHQAR